MFIVRSLGEAPPGVRVALTRRTPPIVADANGQVDLFCVGEDTERERLREQGWQVVPLHDGWYADDARGGVAVWGQARYWEVRDTPFGIKERDGSPE